MPKEARKTKPAKNKPVDLPTQSSDDLASCVEKWVNTERFIESNRGSFLNPDEEIHPLLQLASESDISIWESDIAKKVPRAIERLNTIQRRRLSLLVTDSIGMLESYQNYRKYKTVLADLSNEKKLLSQQRRLDKKISKAKKAIEELLEYAKGLQPYLSNGHIRAANDALNRLSRIGPHHSFKYWQERREFALQHEDILPCPENPIRYLMARLAWFFVCECGLSSNESEVRVALIRNTLWIPYARSITEKNIIMNPQAGESIGCTTIRTAMATFPQTVFYGGQNGL